MLLHNTGTEQLLANVRILKEKSKGYRGWYYPMVVGIYLIA